MDYHSTTQGAARWRRSNIICGMALCELTPYITSRLCTFLSDTGILTQETNISLPFVSSVRVQMLCGWLPVRGASEPQEENLIWARTSCCSEFCRQTAVRLWSCCAQFHRAGEERASCHLLIHQISGAKRLFGLLGSSLKVNPVYAVQKWVMFTVWLKLRLWQKKSLFVWSKLDGNWTVFCVEWILRWCCFYGNKSWADKFSSFSCAVWLASYPPLVLN